MLKSEWGKRPEPSRIQTDMNGHESVYASARAMDIQTGDLAQSHPRLRSVGDDVSSADTESSRPNRAHRNGHHDWPANLLLARPRFGERQQSKLIPTFAAAISTAAAAAPAASATEKAKMMIHRHGVPHKVCFDWRGACLWMIQLAVILVLVGLVR